MKIDERHLAQLAAVVEAGSVTAGAARLHLTQPAVSRTLSALERRIGEPLFVKGRRPLRPTLLGASLAAHGARVLAASRLASETLERHRRGDAGLVRIGGTPFFMDALVGPMIARFQREAPDVRVEQGYGYTEELVALVRDDRLDLALCPIDLLEPGSGLRFVELLPGRNVVACRTGHPLVAGRPAGTGRPPAADLLAHPWVAPPPGSPLYADLRRMLQTLGASEVDIRLSGGSLASVVSYLGASDALAILPHSVVFAYRRDGAITALPVDVEQPPRALGLLHLADGVQAPAVTRFGGHLETEFGELKHLIARHERAVVWGS